MDDADVSISFALCKPWGKFVQYMVCCTKTTCFFMVQSSVTMLRTTVHTYPAALCSDTGEVINILVRMSIIINLRSFTRCKDRMLSGGSISRICGREPVPGIVAVFVFAFIGAWNELIAGTIFINTPDMWTIPVGLKSLIGKYNVQWGALMAGGILALLPTGIMFIFVQKYVVEGLTAGAVKG